jgi:exopolysaccharide production protein ExoZ
MWLRRQFELSRGSAGSNILPMEGIRGFAVFLVFLVHYATLVAPWLDRDSSIMVLVSALHTVGNAGVDLFFVLSGYLIYGTLISRQQQFLPFIRRRIKRIYPTFIAVFLAYLVLSFLFPAESKIPSDAPVSYLIQNLLLLPGIFNIEPMITVAWSLSYEMFYYLAMPIIVMALRLRTHRPEWRILLTAVTAALTAWYCTQFGGHIRLIMFMTGILLHEAIRSGQVRAPSSATALLALVAGLLITLLPITGQMKIAFLFASFYAFCLCCFLRPTDWLARACSWAPLRWLGNMSYSYYLVHGLALKAGFLVLQKTVPSTDHEAAFFFLLLPVMFGLTLVAAILLFLCVERPFSLQETGSRSYATYATPSSK